MAKYFADVSGVMTEVTAITTSAGAGDSGKIAALDSTGRFDISFMPVGLGAEVTVVPSSENLTAGNWINIWNNAGAANARKADATTSAKPADGFVLTGVTSPANATVYGISTKNTGLSGLTPGTPYYLHTTAGSQTTTSPTGSGNLVQMLGTAESATAIVLSNTKFYWVKA